MRFIRLNGICACEAEQPLTEFRLFKAGPNESSKGTFIFDDIAAQSVMADYAKAGVDVMLDLEHLSLDSKAPAYNPDAMGWCKLEVRNGELWACNVKWTNSGEWRLRDKSQRYVSPAFSADDANRITSIVNIALVAMPATYEAQELIAASKRAQLSKDNSSMDPKLIKAALEALMAGDAEKCAQVLQAILESAITGEAAADTPEAETPAADAAASALSIDVAGANLLLSNLLKSTGAKDATEALQIVETWGKAQTEVLSQKAGLELSSRRMLIADLVKLGVETPATAWEGDDKTLRIPVKRLSVETLEELRARVKTLTASRAGGQSPPLKPELGSATVTLTAIEKEACKKNGVDEADYLKRKTALLKRSVWAGQEQQS